MASHEDLSKREHQIMEVLFKLRSATANEIRNHLPGQPSNSAVRTLLRILEEKGFVEHREKNLRFYFEPVDSRENAQKSAISRLLSTFFGGSIEKVAAAIMDIDEYPLSSEVHQRLTLLIEQAKKEETAL